MTQHKWHLSIVGNPILTQSLRLVPQAHFEMMIRGLELPELLSDDLARGGRQLSAHQVSLLKQKLVFLSVPIPELYRSSNYIEECNEVWDSTSADDYIGSASEIVTPGFIVPAKTLIIGEAEPDSPIALDYRTPGPRVVYMGDVDRRVHWIELSPDYATFIRELE